MSRRRDALPSRSMLEEGRRRNHRRPKPGEWYGLVLLASLSVVTVALAAAVVVWAVRTIV